MSLNKDITYERLRDENQLTLPGIYFGLTRADPELTPSKPRMDTKSKTRSEVDP